MYFVAEGQVEIQLKPAALFLGPGQFFGEIALLTGGTRTATVVAARPCTLLTLDIVDFREMVGRQPDLARAIQEEANRRLIQDGLPPTPLHPAALEVDGIP
jgi:CRP-like cAMP-binding protein